MGEGERCSQTEVVKNVLLTNWQRDCTDLYKERVEAGVFDSEVESLGHT